MRRYLLAVGLFTGFYSMSQDLHFAQSAQTNVFINPASTGVYDGWERGTVNHRNQWLGANTQFMTTAISAETNIGKNDLGNNAHAALGLLFYNDIGGDSKFGNQTALLSFSGILPLGGLNHTLSIGIQGGIGVRKANLEGVTFMSQWTGSDFDASAYSGENNTLTSFRYADASAGIQYVFNGGNRSFSRNNNMKFTVGVAGYHLNAPEMKYVNGSGDKLHRKYVGHMSIVSDIGRSKMAIDASAVQFIQGGHYETLLGLMLRYRFESNTKQTGHSQDAFIGIGCYGRISDAIIPAVMIDWKGFQFGVSYDVTVTELKRAYGGGSLEFSLSYTNRNIALFKTKKNRF